MVNFNKDYVEIYLAVVRKYMQLRQIPSQKELAEKTNIGISTMSRFLGQKTTELNAHLIARITATLQIPLSEFIDFVEEKSVEEFKRLVSFYKGDAQKVPPPMSGGESEGTADKTVTAQISLGGRKVEIPFTSEGHLLGPDVKGLYEQLSKLTPAQRAYVVEFLNMDVNTRDLVVDLGNTLIRYFRQRGMPM
jgi:transcriptional regulator with XRE-family HTH domain